MEDDIITKALCVEPLPADYEPDDTAPVDGYEYLKRVQYEARLCPVVTVAHIEAEKIKSETPYLALESSVTTVNENLLPSMDWQHEQVADFSEVRQKLAMRKPVNDQSITLPADYSEESWFRICVGEDLNDNRNQKTPKRKIYHDPSVLFLQSMNQDTLSAILEYFTEWIRDDKTTVQRSGRWIYAILACLDIPLLPETCDSLRKLSKMAASERSKLTSFDSETVNPLNLIICLVGRYFGQLDLADEL